MSALQAKKIRGALKKAQNVGRSEESVTVDGCTIVLRSMPSSDYDAILKEVEDLDGSEYLHEYQNGYLCRAIAEIEGVDLRNVSFIEEEVPDGSYVINAAVSTEAKAKRAKEELSKLGIDLVVVPPDGSEGERTILLERHEWLRKQIKTWSQEAVAIAWRKYADVVVAGEARAKDKIEFRTPDETPEDKFRRLLSEAKALETTLPEALLTSILAESGYYQKTSATELDQVNQRLKAIAQTQEAPTPIENSPLTPSEEPTRFMAVPPVAEPKKPSSSLTAEDLALKIRTRTPLNRVEPSEQGVTPRISPNSRAAQIAELEGLDLSDPSLVDYSAATTIQEVPEISKKAPIDGKSVRIDAPPMVGLNPRFRPHNG